LWSFFCGSFGKNNLGGGGGYGSSQRELILREQTNCIRPTKCWFSLHFSQFNFKIFIQGIRYFFMGPHWGHTAFFYVSANKVCIYFGVVAVSFMWTFFVFNNFEMAEIYFKTKMHFLQSLLKT